MPGNRNVIFTQEGGRNRLNSVALTLLRNWIGIENMRFDIR
jgi:hypothetical protein